MEIEQHWPAIKQLFKQAFASSMHCSIASVNADGEPHITPIGSVILGKPGKAIYFERFPKQLPLNLQGNNKICVLAVNSSRWYWLKSLLAGKFAQPPAIRLIGTAGKLRPASEQEIAIWQRRVKLLSRTKGHALMWKDMSAVRELEFTHAEPIQLGKTTSNNWQTPTNKENHV